MLDIFFTNKIPSTQDGWTDELIRVASIFNEFDGEQFDYEILIERFATISRRVPDVRDSSDYRDEYGAYASYLGIMNYEKYDTGTTTGWIHRVNPRAKNLLCSVEPDPEAYMRLQLALFQYPNPIGAKFLSNGNIGIEPLSLNKRMELIQNGVQTSPFRLFLRILIYLAEHYGATESYLTLDEIWTCLFTKAKAVGTFDPEIDDLARDVLAFRRSSNRPIVTIPTKALRNIHILSHTGLIIYEQGNRSSLKRIILEPDAVKPKTQLGKIARAIANLTDRVFPPSDTSRNGVIQWTKDVLESGEWAEYYTGNEVTIEEAGIILNPVITVDNTLLSDPASGSGAPLHNLVDEIETRKKKLASRRRANPEETKILREKANFQHRAIISLLSGRLKAIGAQPLSNIFIDVAAEFPAKKMIFEIKSCNLDNLLSQVRKGVSQLYEYRYRHEDLHGAKPVLVLETRPANELEWIIEYLIKDRGIAVCWLEGEDTFAAPNMCADCLGSIVHRLEA